jgi:hypothetical protein
MPKAPRQFAVEVRASAGMVQANARFPSYHIDFTVGPRPEA